MFLSSVINRAPINTRVIGEKRKKKEEERLWVPLSSTDRSSPLIEYSWSNTSTELVNGLSG